MLPMLLSTLLFFANIVGSENPKKIVMSDDLLDKINELEAIYVEFLKSGLKPEFAQSAAVKLYELRYPVRLETIPEEKSKDKKKGKK